MLLPKQIFFTYIQLLYLQFFDNIYLLKKIVLKNINNKLYSKLEKTTKNINKLLNNILNY